MQEKLVYPKLKHQKMVKNLSQSSVKISNNKKMQFNSLVKVLKPKVFIIDSSNFKSLVHELTGNANNNYPTTKNPEERFDQAPIMDLEHGHKPAQEATMSMDASFDSSEWCNYLPSLSEDHLVQTRYNNMSYNDDDSFFDVSSMNLQMDGMFDHSCLFDVVEPSPSLCNIGYAPTEQEVSIYDYGYSG